MSAVEALKAARASGVEFALDGDDLLLTAPAPPPAALVDMLAHHKAELVELLRPRGDGWSAQDWQAYYDERAGIIEYDGGVSRPEAEAQALDCCISEWLRRCPVGGSSGRCLGCGEAERSDDAVLVFGRNHLGAWLHSGCWPAWSACRIAEAHSALVAMGIGSPVELQDDFGNIGGE